MKYKEAMSTPDRIEWEGAVKKEHQNKYTVAKARSLQTYTNGPVNWNWQASPPSPLEAGWWRWGLKSIIEVSGAGISLIPQQAVMQVQAYEYLLPL